MEWSNSGQLYNLFLSCGFGFLVGAYYDVFRVIRLMLPCRRGAVFFQDVFFFVTFAAATFLFDLTLTGGQLRFYLFIGMGAGFAAYHFTLGRFVMAFARTILQAIGCFFRLIWRGVCWPFRLAGRLLRRPLMFLRAKGAAFVKKVVLFLKKGLKQSRGVLYNQRNKKAREQAAERTVGIEGTQKSQKTRQCYPAGSGFGFFGVHAGHPGAAAHADRRKPKAARRMRGSRRTASAGYRGNRKSAE